MILKRNGISTLILASLAILPGCFSSGVRSTGAVLPQANENFEDSELRVKIDHNCSGARCTSFDAEFENLGDGKIEILPKSSKISRGGEAFPLAPYDAELKSFVVPPRAKAEFEFKPVNKDNASMSYVKATQVWCSLKVDSECKDPSKGEAMCAGFARYYHQSYVSAGGWIGVEISYRNSQNKIAKLSTVAPTFFGDPPPVKLEAQSASPSWLSGSDEVVFHKVECDDKCRCNEVEKRRNFFTDDKFLVEPK